MSEEDREGLRHVSAGRRRREGAERMQSVAIISMTPTVPKEGGHHAAGVRAPKGPAQCGMRARRR